jgi:hypothetical protein
LFLHSYGARVHAVTHHFNTRKSFFREHREEC